MLVVALSMLFLAALLNLIAIQYAQGVVRAALDEGVRMGSVAHATERECLDGIRRVMGDLLSGPLGAERRFRLHSDRRPDGGLGRCRVRWLVPGDAFGELLHRCPGGEGIR